MLRPMVRWVACGLLVLTGTCFEVAPSARAETKTIARCGQGFLESVDGYRVLHLKGTPYEMGYQQGALLKDDIKGARTWASCST